MDTPGQAEQDDPGAIDTKEPRNDCTPTIRGHQLWRLSIPAEFPPSVRVLSRVATLSVSGLCPTVAGSGCAAVD
jgi:hypothetical protein